MRCGRFILALGLASPVAAGTSDSALASENAVVAVVVGAAGQPEYGEAFEAWAQRWQEAAAAGGATFVQIGGESRAEGAAEGTDRDRLQQCLAAHAVKADAPLWLVLIGHGTFLRDTANFNLRGPDVSSKELAQWLAACERPVVIANCFSASGAFLRDLAAPGRAIVTATQSGAEQNFSRFGDYFSRAIIDRAADLDHDEQVSLLEAFLSASGQVAQFYEDEARLATEHAILDDNGDGLGTRADFYRGVRAVRAARDDAPLDGDAAARIVLVPGGVDRGFTPEQLAARTEIEAEIATLRSTKSELEEAEYYARLEPLLVRLARLYAEAEAASAETRPAADSSNSQE
jgi:hypothetical protein